MGLFNWLSGLLQHDTTEDESMATSVTDPQICSVNPATGLPMIDGMGSVDVAGNPYGADLHSHDSMLDIMLGDTGCSMDQPDPFDSGLSSHWDD